MLNITVSDLDEAGRQANAFNKTSNEGGNVTIKLGQVIDSLKTNWIGSDATMQINSLIDIRSALYDIARSSIQISYETVQVIRAMQEVRSSNGGGAITVSSPEITSMPATERDITKLQDTNQYDVKEGANQDYTSLTAVRDGFNSFLDQYNSDYNTLTSNWTEGGHREELVQIHKSLNEHSSEFLQVLETAIKNLETALQNIASLNSGN